MQVRTTVAASVATIALLTAAGCAVFGKDAAEKGTAKSIARAVNGVMAVKNEIAVRLLVAQTASQIRETSDGI